MPITDLPIALCEQIVQRIKEKRTLKSLSLVSSEWCSLAHRSLFLKLCVRETTGKDYDAVQEFLATASRPAGCVHWLMLQGTEVSHEKSRLNVDTLHSILILLPALERVTIENTSFAASPSGHNAPRGVHQLSQLHLWHVGTPEDSAHDFFASLGMFSYIGRLLIHDLSSFNDTASIAQVNQTKLPAMVDHLAVSELLINSADICPILLQTLIAGGVETVTFQCPEAVHLFGTPSLPHSLPSLLGAASMLEHIAMRMFRVGFLDDAEYLEACADAVRLLKPALNQLPSLGSVRLTLQMIHLFDAPAVILCWTGFLSIITMVPPHIRRLELDVRFDPGPTPSSLVVYTMGARGAWALAGIDFRALQTRILGFKQLESVVLRGSVPLLKDEKQAIEQGMPNIVRSGLICYA